MNNERQIAKQLFDKHFMFKENPIAWTAWKMAFQLGIEHQRALQQCDVSLSLPPSESSEEIICSNCGVRDAIQTGKHCICCGAELPQLGGNAS